MKQTPPSSHAPTPPQQPQNSKKGRRGRKGKQVRRIGESSIKTLFFGIGKLILGTFWFSSSFSVSWVLHSPSLS